MPACAHAAAECDTHCGAAILAAFSSFWRGRRLSVQAGMPAPQFPWPTHVTWPKLDSFGQRIAAKAASRGLGEKGTRGRKLHLHASSVPRG